MTTTTLERSWLVQRLTKPRNYGQLKDNPFNFGGGLKNGGLSDEAMGLIRGIWEFDYMGSAEFEFGAVPKALNKIAHSSLVAFSFTVPLAEVPAHWKNKSKTIPEGDGTLYVICPQEHREEIEARIREWATSKYPDLKEGLRLTTALRPIEEWDSERCGWLELDNGFLFFTAAEMWAQTCELFGVKA